MSCCQSLNTNNCHMGGIPFGYAESVLLLDVTVKAQLVESEHDSPDGETGKLPSVIHTALTFCCCSRKPSLCKHSEQSKQAK